MADELPYPGLKGASISSARSPLDPSFEPGEAGAEDVRESLLNVLLSAFTGKPMTPGAGGRSAGGRVVGKGRFKGGGFRRAPKGGGPAYDYDKQKWETGGRGEELRRQQMIETLQVIDKPDYQKMMGYTPAQVAEIKAGIRRELGNIVTDRAGNVLAPVPGDAPKDVLEKILRRPPSVVLDDDFVNRE